MDRQQRTGQDANKPNQCNPNHAPTGPGRQAAYTGDASKANLDNRSQQMNPNNDKYQGK